jgi:neutral ceramidase
MRIGAASSPLAVPLGTALGGYADRVTGATGTLDELQVWCVRLGGLTLVVADVVCVRGDLADSVSAALGGGPVWTAATHTHSGPDLNCGPGIRPTPPPWLEAIPAAAAEAASRVVTVDATLAWHTGAVHGVGSVRARTGSAPSVPVDVLAARDTDGGLRGVVVVLPVHPTVLPASNTRVSADLTGAVRRAVQRRLGPSAWVVVATGCAGDISTRMTRRAPTPEECDRLGELAAAQIVDVLATEPIHLERGDPPVQARTRTLRLPIRPAEEAPAAPSGDDRIAHTYRQGLAVARERMTRHPDGVAVLRVDTARLGAIRLAGISAEPYLAVRNLVDGVVLGYANGYAGYLPDADAFETPSYEVLSSPFRPDAVGRATRAINEMFQTEESND